MEKETEKNKLHDLAGRYTGAWCSQDPARVAACYSSNGSLKINDAPPAVGRSAITDAAQEFMSAFPDMQVTMDDLRIHADHAEYLWTLTGTNTGPGGMGNIVRISGFEEWEIGNDGLIAKSLGHFDAAEYERQLKGR
jgi:nuclear transport factor 2 (NTF2) superfamily protein